MRVHNTKRSPLTSGLQKSLDHMRADRRFNVDVYIQAKSESLNNYLRTHNLSSVVVAVSGGVDSAATLALVDYAAKQSKSPIKKIIPVCLPVFSPGATNQDKATSRGEELIKALGLKPFVIDVSKIFNSIQQEVDQALNKEGKPWAQGQLVSYARTPTLYYITSLLSQEGTPGVLVGTTNKDEGAFIGYFGKASDGLVDVQLISDIHKSEVYEVSKKLGVPLSILEVTPTGDMFDGRSDEEVFGTSYAFVEFYNLYLELPKEKQELLKKNWTAEDLDSFSTHESNILKLHGYNKHKYIGASPAVHLDVIKTHHRHWKNNTNFSSSSFPEKAVNLIPSPTLTSLNTETSKIQDKDGIILLKNVFSIEECEELKKHLNNFSAVEAGIDGYRKTGDTVGSLRRSFYSEAWAKNLFFHLRPYLKFLYTKEELGVEAQESSFWEATGINPLVRSIQYKDQGFLIPHYDAPVIFNEHTKTLMSVVIYLDNVEQGKTRFIKGFDPEFKDWSRQAEPTEIKWEVPAKQGDVLIFNHRLLHDGDTVKGSKHILRTDLIFEGRNGIIKN